MTTDHEVIPAGDIEIAFWTRGGHASYAVRSMAARVRQDQARLDAVRELVTPPDDRDTSVEPGPHAGETEAYNAGWDDCARHVLAALNGDED